MNAIPQNREIVMTDSAPDYRTALLVEMSRDPGIQAEIAAIDREFAIAEMDGLRSDLKCLHIDD